MIQRVQVYETKGKRRSVLPTMPGMPCGLLGRTTINVHPDLIRRSNLRIGSFVNQMQAVGVDIARSVGRVKSTLHNLQAGVRDSAISSELILKLLDEAQKELDKIVD